MAPGSRGSTGRDSFHRDRVSRHRSGHARGDADPIALRGASIGGVRSLEINGQDWQEAIKSTYPHAPRTVQEQRDPDMITSLEKA